MKSFTGNASDASSLSAQVLEKIEDTGGSLGMVSDKISDISESTGTIVESVDVIKDIADKVNLLSLNASIEAARAGDAGRGFAVVADEISKLADITQSNAGRITEAISGMVKKVADGMGAVKAMGTSFGDIREHITHIVKAVTEIAGSAEGQSRVGEEMRLRFKTLLDMTADNLLAAAEQAKAYQEINANVNQVSEQMQHFAGEGENIKEMSRDLAAQAERLMKEMSFFKLKGQ